MLEKRLAAFIITYERTEILLKTINKILEQTLPPEKILIIDNSITNQTKQALKDYDPRVVYYAMKYNAGPAGGAKKGLEILAQEGYEWIYWGDDNDPPPTKDCFERLLIMGDSFNGTCGQVGVVGHKFNKITGRIKRTSNDELLNKKYIEVDNIGGNMCKIIHSRTILSGVLPDEKLFFGFEELDFDLALKKAGFKIIVDSKLFLNNRKATNRLQYKRSINTQKSENRIWREYYSIRNTLYIMKKNRYYSAFLFTFLSTIIKVIFSFKHGFRYGIMIGKVSFRAIEDFRKGKFYKVEI